MIGLRILHLATSLAAAKAGDVLTTMTWLQQNGHEVAIAAGGEDEIPGFTVLRYKSGAASWWLGGKRALMEQVEEWRPDIVHLHGIEALAAARAIAKSLEVPIVLSVDDVLAPQKGKELNDPAISWILVPTEAHRAHYIGRLKLARDGVAQLPFTFHYDTVVAASAREAHDADAPSVIGIFLRDEIDVNPILKQCDELIATGKKFTCLVGHNDDIENDELAEQIITDKNRPWLSVKNMQNTGELLPHIDIFVQPNTENRVAPLIKAMAAGRPVIAAADVGIDEIIQNNQTGLIAQADDPQSIGKAITSLLDNTDLCQELAVAGQKDARARFDIEVIGAALLELYRNAISAIHHPENKGEGSKAYRRQITH